MKNKTIEDLIGLKDIDKNMLKNRKNGLLLTDNQINVLARYNIDANKCTSETELLYMIDRAIEGSDEDEYADLEAVAESLSERNYYQNTRK